MTIKVADFIPEQVIDQGPEKGKVLVLGWGSTYGAIKSAIRDLHHEGYADVSHAHVRYIHPFPKNLGKLLNDFEKVLVPEMNNGQLVKLIRERFLMPAIPYNKIQGIPFKSAEIREKILEVYQ